MKVVVGGQAVIEGVLMRGPECIVTAVRKQDKSIVYKKKNISMANNKLFKIPFLRGVIALFDAMVIGTKELIFSANVSGMEEEKLTDKQIILTVISSLAISIGLFMLLPSVVSTFIFSKSKFLANILEAVIRVSLFIFYVYLMTLSKDMKRIFEYHGAEHKSIMTFEKNLELTVENAKTSTRFHPRCGTSFLLIVMVISIFIFSIVDVFFNLPSNIFLLLLYKLFTRVLLVPVVASISYELQRYTSKTLNSIFSRCVAKPGLWLQKLTTSEPDDSQLEVALVALKVALGMKVDNATEVYEG